MSSNSPANLKQIDGTETHERNIPVDLPRRNIEYLEIVDIPRGCKIYWISRFQDWISRCQIISMMDNLDIRFHDHRDENSSRKKQ